MHPHFASLSGDSCSHIRLHVTRGEVVDAHGRQTCAHPPRRCDSFRRLVARVTLNASVPPVSNREWRSGAAAFGFCSVWSVAHAACRPTGWCCASSNAFVGPYGTLHDVTGRCAAAVLWALLCTHYLFAADSLCNVSTLCCQDVVIQVQLPSELGTPVQV
jgi:hypothetical protein